jgi:hypothetical protein
MEAAMATPGATLWNALCGLVVAGVAVAQTAPAVENWVPTSRSAKSITGKVTFAADQITFQNGSSLTLVRSGQMLFRAEKGKKRVTVELYRVTPPQDPVLEGGNRLCNGKPIAYLLVWKSERLGNDLDPRSVNAFSGQKFEIGSSDDCGRYVYDAGAH